MKPVPGLPELLDRLEQHHGPPRPAPPKSALEWILWENAAYLVPDAKRSAAYAALKKATKLSARGLLALPREELLELARLGGMMPDRRVEKLLAIATTVLEEFGGDLDAVPGLPLREARRALKKFPGIGDPGADKILLFVGAHDLAALESNGLRVVVRLGLAAEGKSYAATYRAAIRAFEPHLVRGGAWLRRTHELLRAHGQALCKNSSPLCEACPLAGVCPSA